MELERFRVLEIGGGAVTPSRPLRFTLPAVAGHYADAQIDDYGDVGHRRTWLKSRRYYPWQRGTALKLRARFSHAACDLRGTAGFGVWNAPFGDPTIRWPALPQAAWFFFASPPSDLPLARRGPGRGWFASTIDATTWRSIRLIPAAPFVLLANQFPALRERIWPAVRQRLGISHASLSTDIQAWHAYNLTWGQQGCVFRIDGQTVLETQHSPQGPMGFVCWLDNQFLKLTNCGAFAAGSLSTDDEQWLEIDDLEIRQIEPESLR